MEIEKIIAVEQTEDVVQLISSAIRPGYTKQILEWQYSDYISNLHVISENKQIGGIQGMIHLDLKSGKNQFVSHKSETSYLSTAYRGKGAFEKIYDRCVENAIQNGSQLIWGFTALGNLWEKKLGFYCDRSIIHEAMLVTKVDKNVSFARRIYHSWKMIGTSLKMLPIKKAALSFINPDKAKLALNKLNDEFTESSIHLDYGSDSIRNRIFNSPIIQYQFFEISEHNETKGLLIYHLKNNQLFLSDFIYFGNNDIRSIIKSLFLHVNKSEKICSIKFWGNINYVGNQSIFKAFRSLGAKITPVDDMQLVYKPTSTTEIKTAHLVINGLWTEGFTY